MDNEFTLSRRKTLAALGSIGAASVGAGLGTSAYFSDQETFQNNEIVAGSVDLFLDWQQRLTQSSANPVNAYPDPTGDGVQSMGGIQFAGSTGNPVTPHHIPDVCGYCGDGQIALRQGDQNVCLDVIQGGVSVEEFYDYRGVSGTGDYQFSSGNRDIQADDAGRIFFYREPGGDLYLVVIFGQVESGNGGQATFDFVGLDGAAGSAPWVLEDDDASYDPDEYSAQQAVWGWVERKTDGGVAGPLTPVSGGDGFCLAIEPTISGVAKLQALDGDTDTVVDLDPSETLVFCSETGLQSGSQLSVPDVYQSTEAPNQQSLIDISDVKPGDSGEIVFSLHMCDLESYAWMFADNFTEAENGVTEPEADDPDEDGTQANPGTSPELADVVQTRFWYDENCNEQFDEADNRVIFEGSLREAVAVFTQTNANGVPGVPLDGDPSTPYDEITNGTIDDGVDPNRECFTGQSTICIGFEWWLPEDHANEAQTDSAQFDLGFYVEQCASNDGSGMGPEQPSQPIAQQVQIESDPNADPDGGQSRHTVSIDVGDGDDGEQLSSIEVAYPTGFDLSGVGLSDVELFYEGTDRSGSITGFSVSGGTDLEVAFGAGAPTLSAGDALNLRYVDVVDAASGTYSVDVTVNGDGTTSASLTI